MGEKFSSSVANLYMAKGEEESQLLKDNNSLTLYKHFIDNLIIIWNIWKANMTELR